MSLYQECTATASKLRPIFGLVERERYISKPNSTIYLRSEIQHIDVEIDSNKWLSDVFVRDEEFNEVSITEFFGSDKILPNEFGSSTIFVWEFRANCCFKRDIKIKYYAFDEFFGFLGGNLSLFLSIVGWFWTPYSFVDYFSNNSSK